MVHKLSRTSWGVAGLALLLILTACESTADLPPSTDPPPLDAPETSISASERTYLRSVELIELDLISGFVGIENALQRVYNTREAVFTAVGDAGLRGLVESTLVRVRSLTPPQRYEEDHTRWLEFHQSLVPVMDDLEEALADRDLQAVLKANSDALRERASMIRDVSASYCQSANPEFPELCQPTESLPGGDYGRAVFEINREQILDTMGLFDFPTDMTPDERSVRLEYVQPIIERSLEAASNRLELLDPPPELSADHQILLGFFREQSQTAIDIANANAMRDDELLAELFERSNVVAERLDGLSSEFKQLLPGLLGP